MNHNLGSDPAFAVGPKIMDGQCFSMAFRESHPKFIGFIWGYRWLQVAGNELDPSAGVHPV